ncbi:acyl-CoA dehydrogenase [Streptosporangium sp. NPDC050280]|uniref:acyl-CoA dehydrogenase n=1 Tax=unclassified Streptosporangium TaxID=2632669 RepID=UPI0034324612
MFDLSPTAAQQSAVEELRSFRPQIREMAREVNRTGRLPADLRTDLSRAAGATPEAITDGSSVLLDPVGLVLVAEELAIADAGTALEIIGAAQAQLLAAALGDSAAVERIGALRAFGDVALGLYEGYGRAPSEYRLRAERQGDQWSLSGRKDPVSHGADASAVLLAGRTDDDASAAFLVEAAGVQVERDDRKEGKLALGLVASAAVRVDGVPVPATARIGASAEEFTVLRAFNTQRLLVPAVSVGLGQAAVDTTAEWVSGRKVRGAALGRNQGVMFPLVDAGIALSRARLQIWDLASRLAEFDTGAVLERRVGRAVAAACAAGTQAARIACNTMGWRGLSQQFLAEARYRDAGVLSAVDFDVLHHNVPVIEAA